MSPRDRASALSTPRSHDEATPTIQGYVRYNIGPVTSGASSNLRASPVWGGAESSPEERLQAITAAARNLKEKIIEQSRVVESMAELEQKDQSRSRRSRVSWRGEQREEPRHERSRARLPAHIPAEPTAFGMRDLPGVGGLQSHASQAAKARKENEAARKIQAAYRGHVVRKSLHWALPSGGTLKDTMQGARKGGDGGEEVEEDGTGTDDTLTPTDQSSVVEVERKTISAAPTQGASVKDRVGMTPVIVAPPPPREGVPSVPSEPWMKSGGDRHSVVNIFARRHQHSYFGGVAGGRGEDLNASARSVEGRPFVTPESLLGEVSVPVTSSSSSSVLQGPLHSTELASSSSGSFSAVTSSSVNGAVGGMPFDRSSGRASLQEVDEFLENSQNSVRSMPSTADSSSAPKLLTSSHSSLSQATLTPTPPRSASVTPVKKDAKTSDSLSLSNTSSRSKEEEEDSISAITPPGSSGLVGSYTSSNGIPRLASPLPDVLAGRGGTGHRQETPMDAGGRYSPRSLDLKLQAELNHLDVVTSTIGHVSEVERTRAVSLAQQETVNVAQLLKSQQEAHKKKMEEIAAKSEREKEQRLREVAEESRERATRDRAAETRRMREDMEAKLSEQNRKIAMVLEGSNKVMVEVASRLQDVRSSRTNGTGSGTSEEPKMSVDVVRGIAESAAGAAAREAVTGVLSGMIPSSSASRPSMPEVKPVRPDESSTYEEDFEVLSSTPLSKTATVTSTTAREVSEHLEKGSSSPVVREPSDIEEDMEKEEVSGGSGMEKSEVSEDLDETTGVEDTEEQKDGGSGMSGPRSESVVDVTDVSGETRTNEEGMEEVRWPVSVFVGLSTLYLQYMLHNKLNS